MIKQLHQLVWGVVDVFEATGLSILSDDFWPKFIIWKYGTQNLAVEVLRKLLADEIKMRVSRNCAKDTKFSER